MRIVKVREKNPVVPLAFEIEDEVDLKFLGEVLYNTYGGDGWCSKRGEGRIGEGIIDVNYGHGDYDRTHIRPGETGWLLIGEDAAYFYKGEWLWSEYEEA